MKNTLTRKLLVLGTSSTVAIAGGYLIGPWEGKENTAYKDMVGVVTACYGQTKGVKMGDVFTDEECEKDLASELTKYNTGMKRHVKVDLSPQEEIAYTSFVWNLGETNFKNSSLLKKLNAGDREGACRGLMDWNKVTVPDSKTAQAYRNRGESCTAKKDGKYSCTVKGLTNRRTHEMNVCLKKDSEVNEALRQFNAAQNAPEALENTSEGVDESEVNKELPSAISPTISLTTNDCKWKFFNICLRRT